MKLQKVVTARAAQNIDDTLSLLLAFNRHIDYAIPVAKSLLVIVQGRSLVRRQLRDP
jgi:hypothetical protein